MERPLRCRTLDTRGLREMLGRVASGELTPEQAVAWLEDVPVLRRADVEPDTSREARTGQPEVIYGPGKSPAQVVSVARALAAADVRPIVVSRATDAQARAVRAEMPDAAYHERAGLVVIRSSDRDPSRRIAVISAGTSDLPVAEEAALVAEAFGLEVDRIADVGVAGVHRILAHVPTLERAGCVIVVAGMEGALPSVVAGLIPAPVVAVPTSVGYGATFGGLAALLGMLSSCVPGVVTVNVDNGVGAAMAAHRIVGT